MSLGVTIDKFDYSSVMSNKEAFSLAKKLNESEDACGWEYSVKMLGDDEASVEVFDEDGFFLGTL